MAEQPLGNVKILDLTQYIPGPYCTKLLAGYGADVIKIEKPGTGDIARRIGPFYHDDPHPEKSGLFFHLNTNKRGITLNLKSETGKTIFKQLVKDADIVVESYRPGTMARFGLDYETLEKINPRLVMTSISNFGQTGPYRDYKLSELTLNAMSVAMYIAGRADRPPTKRGGTSVMHQAGLIAAGATVGALLGCSFHGIGQHVDVAITETQQLGTEYGSLDGMSYILSGIVSQRSGGIAGGRASIVPMGTYSCKDGFIQFYGAPAYWERLVKLMQKPDLLSKYPNKYDVSKIPEVLEIFQGWLNERTMEQVMFAAQKERVPITALKTPKQVVEDPQWVERGTFVEVAHPVMGNVKIPGLAIRFGETNKRTLITAPLLGQHNAEVYGQLGYTREDLVKMNETGVI